MQALIRRAVASSSGSRMIAALPLPVPILPRWRKNRHRSQSQLDLRRVAPDAVNDVAGGSGFESQGLAIERVTWKRGKICRNEFVQIGWKRAVVSAAKAFDSDGSLSGANAGRVIAIALHGFPERGEQHARENHQFAWRRHRSSVGLLRQSKALRKRRFGRSNIRRHHIQIEISVFAKQSSGFEQSDVKGGA